MAIVGGKGVGEPLGEDVSATPVPLVELARVDAVQDLHRLGQNAAPAARRRSGGSGYPSDTTSSGSSRTARRRGEAGRETRSSRRSSGTGRDRRSPEP